MEPNSTVHSIVHLPGVQMKLFVKNGSTGNLIKIKAKSDSSIQMVKLKIEMKKGIPSDQQKLVYNGRQLLDKRTLNYYQIKENSCVNLGLRAVNMQITICTFDFKELQLAVASNDTVEYVKSLIEDQEHHAIEHQVLMRDDIKLENNRILSDYHIKSDKILLFLNNKIQFYVQTNNGILAKFDSRTDIATKQLKAMISAKLLVCVKSILTYCEEPLDDQFTLIDYKIKKDDTLYLNVSITRCEKCEGCLGQINYDL